MKQTNQGLSLVELMVVVAMVGILSAIAIPSYNNLIASEQLTASANRLQTGFKYARSEAMKRSETVHLKVQQNKSIKITQGNEELKIIPAPDAKVTVTGLADISVSPLGTTASANIKLERSGQSLRLCILRSGQSQLTKNGCPT